MATLDILLIVIFVAGAIVGFKKGFIKQLAGLAGLIIGLLAAKSLYAVVAEKYMSGLTGSMTLAHIIAFILIWIVVPFLFTLVAGLLTKALEAIKLGWINRWLGAALGALKWIVAASLVIGVLEYIDSDNQLLDKELKSQSALYYPAKQVAGIFLPMATNFAKEIINPDSDNRL